MRRRPPDPPRTLQPQAQSALVLDRYRLQRRLGAGAFGTVWQAHDERLDREVAVKIVPRERVVGGRFEREARAAARLQHPGIVTLYEAGADDEGAYLVSELVRGVTLDQLLADGRLSDSDIITIGIGLCDALGHAHGQSVIHRDVKPSNILIPERPTSQSDRVKLTDFGVARVIGGDSLTRTGDVVGTAAYMAPEQAEGLEAGAPADLYALALVLYEALTGVNPIRAATAAQRARRLGAHLPPLRRQRRDLPRELGRCLDLALRPKPRERGTIEELRASLRASLPELTDHPGIVTGPWRAKQRDQQTGTQDPLGLTPRDAAIPAVFADQEVDEPSAPAPPAWPERGLAALAAGALAAWIASHALSSAPVSPAAVGLAAGAITLALPRIGWLAALGVLAATAAAHDQVGLALVLALAGLLPVLALPRAGVSWPLGAAAPALAALGLAGAWPALAARAKTPYRRAALGTIGYVWVVVADAGMRIPGRVAAGLWVSSPFDTLHHMLIPIITSGALAPALAFGVAAVVLPFACTGRSPLPDLVRVTIWATVLVSATAALGQSSTLPAMTLGVLVGAILTLAPGAATAYRARHVPSRLVP